MRVYTHLEYDRGHGSDAYIQAAVKHCFGVGAGFERVGGVPRITPEGTGYISVAHSGGYLAVALSRKPVGIDTELIDERRNYRAIAAKMGWGHADVERFYELWTEHEARFKCGLTDGGFLRRYDLFKDAATAVVSAGGEEADFYPLEQIMNI